MDEIIQLDAVGAATAIRRGEVSAVELAEAHLARIDRLDAGLRSFVAVDADGARRAAEAVDRGEIAGPLAGATLSVKDVEDVAGLPTTHSCDLLVDHIAAHDGPVAGRFRAAGLVILGKSNTPEFCTSLTTSRLNGVCRNPWDTALTPGGSSGGAAAGLAAGLCSAAHGTDGAGSVRVPAAYCGLVGLKPTRGLVAFGPLDGPAYFQTSVPGVLSRSVRDAAALLDALAPPGPWTPSRPGPFLDELTQHTGPLRIAITVTPPAGEVDPECVIATRAAGRVLESLGHHVVETTPAWDVLAPANGLPMSAPGPTALLDPADAERVEPRNAGMVRRMSSMTLFEHARLVDETRAATRRFLPFWDDVDVLVTPATGLMAPSAEFAMWDLDLDTHNARLGTFPALARPFNVTGQPALSVPIGWSSAGLPIGIQLAGRHLEEATLLRLAVQLEVATPWADRLLGMTASL
jgi:amidase